MDLPIATDYVVFELIASELVNQETNEFDGQFADLASLKLSVKNP